MDQTTLVGLDIEEGRKLLDRLEEKQIRVRAALWRRGEGFDRWRLTLVMPLVEEKGLREAYRVLDGLLENSSPRLKVDLINVLLLTPQAPFSKGLRRDLRNLHDVPVSNQRIGDEFVDQGYIYFVK